MNHSDIKTIARNVMKIESDTVKTLSDRVDDKFVEAVMILFSCKGRVIVIGIGKSGHIGQKVSSTMASTGTPSYFIHPGEAIHGDLGMITKEDMVLMISNSGETIELLQILPSIKQKNVPIIAITGRKKSILSKEADISLDASVEKEACTLNLAPTASTAAALAIGDALAIALLEYRGFKSDDFAKNHPGGTRGKRLVLKLHDLVHTGSQVLVAHVKKT
jgi:KpsF/GutQ family protein